MKNSFIFKALVAFLVLTMGVNFNAEAQLGGLLNKAKGKVIKSKEQKEFEAESEASKPAIPQPKSGSMVMFMIGKQGVASWDPSKLEVTIMTNRGGNTPGTVVKLDPNTGKFTDANGNAKGSISADGTIESPNFGTLKLEPYYSDVSMPNIKIDHALWAYKVMRGDGEFARYLFHNGEMTFLKDKCTVSDKSVNPLIFVYVFHGLIYTEKDRVVATLGYDPEATYTMADLEDKVEWQDAATERKLRDYETSHAYAGFDKSAHPEMKNVKIGPIGLMTDWKETRDEIAGTNVWNKYVKYWVIYELEDGRNFVGFNSWNENWAKGVSTDIRHNYELHEVTDYQRK